MTTGVLLVVLASAALHAGWNAAVKAGADKLLATAGVMLGGVPFALVLLPFVETPDASSWPVIAGAAVLHTVYQLMLAWSYRSGALGSVYPVARGVSPLALALAGLLVADGEPRLLELLGIALVAISLMGLGLGARAGTVAAGTGPALATGLLIAFYSFVDGHGARVAGTALGYYSWLTIGNVILLGSWLAWREPKVLRQVMTQNRDRHLLGGLASFVAYAAVLWAFTQAPVALVSAVRETGIVFALLFGAIFLNEPVSWPRGLAIAGTFAGVVLIRSAAG